jgi:fumarate reductase subunit C
MNVRLYILQRATAALMAPLVLIHIAVIFYASHQGLSAADMLSRTRGSVAWALFYSVFVAAVAIHASIGVRTVLAEWLTLRGRPRDVAAIMFGLLLLALGLRAVAAVVLPLRCRRARTAPTFCGWPSWCIGFPAWRSRFSCRFIFSRSASQSRAMRGSTVSCAGPISRW